MFDARGGQWGDIISDGMMPNKKKYCEASMTQRGVEDSIVLAQVKGYQMCSVAPAVSSIVWMPIDILHQFPMKQTKPFYDTEHYSPNSLARTEVLFFIILTWLLFSCFFIPFLSERKTFVVIGAIKSLHYRYQSVPHCRSIVIAFSTRNSIWLIICIQLDSAGGKKVKCRPRLA